MKAQGIHHLLPSAFSALQQFFPGSSFRAVPFGYGAAPNNKARLQGRFAPGHADACPSLKR
jgi:hypothetical protein